VALRSCFGTFLTRKEEGLCDSQGKGVGKEQTWQLYVTITAIL
jgi:hypothetical protein